MKVTGLTALVKRELTAGIPAPGSDHPEVNEVKLD